MRLRIQGKVDDWRIQRKCAYLIHRSFPIESPVNIFEEIPLPFDDELKEFELQDMENTAAEAERVYNETQQWYKQNPDWAKLKKVV